MANAYGFIDLQHLYNQRMEEVGVPVIRQALDASLAYHTRQLNELMSAFVTRTTLAQEVYRLPSGGTLQPLDEHGVPKPRKGGESYQVAYPIKGAGTAWGDDRVTRALMTVGGIWDDELDPGLLKPLVTSYVRRQQFEAQAPIYERASSSEFAKLRGGPAIGMGLILLNCVVKRAIVRQYIEQEEATRSSLLDLLALLWGALEVVCGTFLADVWRATQQKDE